MTFKKLTFLICILVSLFIFHDRAIGQITTFKSGTAIIDMGSASPTVKNSLKPYGLVYALLKTNHVPVSVVVNASKVKDGIDFVYNGKSYKGGTFVISAEYISSSVSSALTSWANQGVLIDYAASDFTVDVTYKINFVPRWVMDKTNGVIAVSFLNAAGIPSSAYSFKTPAELGACEDLFVLPHADPTWTSHSNLYDWNLAQKGAIWAGCHAVSVLENLVDPNDPTRKMNFLTTNGLVPFTDHNSASTPFSHLLPGDPIAQYYNKTDNAQLNGSENVYLPKPGSAWNTGTNGAKILSSSPSQPDLPNLDPGTIAAENVYGRGLGNPARGYVAYQASHNIGGTSPDQIAAQRIFFNFSLFALNIKVPPIIAASLNSLPEILTAGVTSSTLTASVTGTGTGFTYQWSASVAGTFSDVTSPTPTFTPSNTITSATPCIITCVVTQPSCGRVSFDSKRVTIIPPVSDHPLHVGFIPIQINDGCATAAVTFNVFNTSYNPADPDAGTRTLLSVTGLGNGALITNVNGDITFTPNNNFKGTTTGSYQVTNTISTSNSGTISITVGDPALAPVLSDDGATALWDQLTTIDVLANDKNNTAAGTNVHNLLYIRDIPVKPSKGFVYINPEKTTLTYVSNSSHPTGIDEFQYLACNTTGYCSVGTLSVTLSVGTLTCTTNQYQTSLISPGSLTGIEPSADSYLDQSATASNFGNVITFRLNGNASGTAERRPILKFDVSAIPATATVTSANITFVTSANFTVASNSNPFPATIYGATKNWTEGNATSGSNVAWANFDGNANPWTIAGGDFTDLSPGAANPQIPNVYTNGVSNTAPVNIVTGDLKNIVQPWLSPANNKGLIIIPRSSGVTVTLNITMHSKEAVSAGNRPKLNVYYTAVTACSAITTTYMPVLYPDAAVTSSALSVTISPLANDGNYYGNTNSLLSFTTPAHGTASITGNQIIYAPNGSFVGTDTMTYTVKDGTFNTTNSGTIRITVSRATPAINFDLATVASGLSVTVNVDANDLDLNAAVAAAPVITSLAKNGVLSVSGNTIVYTPSAGFTGTDTFIYSRVGGISDNCATALSDTALVTITVTNRAPVANPGSLSTFACGPVSINLLSISSDPEGAALSVTTGNPSGGTLTTTANGIYKFIPTTNFVGTGQFTYTVTDPLNATSLAATVTITVSGAANPNTAPIALADRDTTLVNQPVYTNVLFNDSDPNNDPLGISITAIGLTGPLSGTIQLMPNKLVKYNPNSGFSGTDTYQYKLSDTHPGCSGNNSLDAIATVTITVTAIPTTLSGTVYNDVDVSGTVNFTSIQTNTETGTNAGGSIYIYLVDGSNIIKDRTPVDVDGTYTLSNVPSFTSNLKLVLSIEDLSIGSSLTAPSLPNGYVNSSPLTRTVAATTLADMGGYNWGIYVNPLLSPGSITGPGDLCGTSGIPGAFTATANATGGSFTATAYKYQWQSSIVSAVAGFGDISSADTLTGYIPTGAINVTTYYRRNVVTKNAAWQNIDGAKFSNVFTITLNPNPTVGIAPLTATVQAGGNQTLTATGGVTYSWSPASNLSSTNTAVVTAGPLTVTRTYTVTGTITATGCLNTAAITITVINPGVIGTDQSVCGAFTPTTLTSTSNASGDSPITYQWQSSATSATSGFTSIDGATGTGYSPVGISVTTYYRRVASFAGLSFNSNVVTATVKAKPSVAAGSNTPVCRGASINLTSTAGMSGYIWSGPNGFSSVLQNPVISNATLSATGSYTVQVTAANGCTNTASTPVIVNQRPTVVITPSTALINLNANISLTASGADTYTWSPTTALSLTNTATVTAGPLTATFYTATGTLTATGCSNTASITITVVGTGVLIPGNIGSPQTICSGSAVSALTSATNATGGTGTISYQWQQSADNSTFTNITGANLSTYTPPALTQTTYYRRRASTNIDAAVFTSSVKITVQASISGTMSSSSVSVCTVVNSGTLTLTGNTGAIVKWQSSADGGVSFSDIVNTTAIQAFENLTVTTQYRAVVQAGVCAIVNSTPLTVTILPIPVAGPISGPCALPKDSSGVYRIATVADATSYVWTVPVGWTGVSTTNSITVTAGSSNGIISVAPLNGGCAGTAVTFQAKIIDYAKVTITGAPVSAPGNNNNPILVTIQLIDISGNIISCSGGPATLCANSGTFSTVVDHNDGTYTSLLTSSANDVIICGTVAGIPISKTTTVTFTGPQGGIKGNGPILETETPKLTFTATAGRAPFTVIYRSAKSNKNDTLTNVASGVPIGVKLIPTTTLYTLVSVIDANGERRDNNFNRDTATIIVVGPRIIVTLHADPAKLEKDSTWSTRLSLHVKNIGELDLSSVQVKLNLKDVFPSPVTYVLDSVRVNGTTVVANSSYDGVQSNDLFARINLNKNKIPANIATPAMSDMGMGAIAASPGAGNMIDNAAAAILQKENGIEIYGNTGQANHAPAAEETAIANDEHSVYMFGAQSQLPVGVESTMFLYIHLKPNGYYEPFVMQAVALGTGSTEGATALTTSLSNDNNDVNAHPDLTRKGDPQPTVINLIPNPVTGVALSAGTPADQGNGTYNVLLSYKLANYGNVNLQSLQLFHNLSRMIGSPSTFTRIGAIITTGTLVPNTNYDGKLDTNLLVNTSELAYKQEGTIQFTINLTPNQLSSLYRLQATATAFNTDLNATITDLSTDGSNPDPDGNSMPDEKVKTLIVINLPIPPLVPGGIGILVNPSPRTTVLAKTYCASVTGAQIVSTSTPSGGSGPYEYQWQSSVDNISFTDISNATDSIYTTAKITANTYLRKKVISDNQVAFTNSVFIQVIAVAKPVISASGSLTLAVNGSVTLTSTQAGSYTWSSAATTRSIIVTTPGVGPYTVTIPDPNGCAAVSDPVVVLPPPPVTINATYIIGAISNPPNSGVQVTGYPAATLNYYIVSSGGSLIPVPVLPGNTGLFSYYVSQTINGYESARVPYSVTMLDKVADVEKVLSKAPVLQSDGSFLLSFTIYSSNFRNELLDSVKIKDDLSKVFPSGTTYQVVGVKSSGKLLTNSLYNGNTQIDLLADVSQLAGLQKDSVVVTLKVFSNGFSGTLNNAAEQQAKSPYGTFKVTSNDPTAGNGLTVRAPAKFIIPSVDIFIPSGFSPNHDGTNDLFVISKPYNISINMEIFNRWGNPVYRAPDYKNDWDGKGNQPNNILGEDLPDGTYYYIILATDKLNGTVRKFAGFITLKR